MRHGSNTDRILTGGVDLAIPVEIRVKATALSVETRPIMIAVSTHVRHCDHLEPNGLLSSLPFPRPRQCIGNITKTSSKVPR